MTFRETGEAQYYFVGDGTDVIETYDSFDEAVTAARALNSKYDTREHVAYSRYSDELSPQEEFALTTTCSG